MAFLNPAPHEIKTLLERVRTVAVLGLSNDPDRPSYSVAMYLQNCGYRVIPVRPGGGAILGETVYERLADVPVPIDLVDVFRRSTFVSRHVDEALALGIPAIWLQEGVIDAAAAQRARDAGVTVVMDLCMLKEHRRAGLASRPPPRR